MRSFRAKPVGWRYESYRHSLAARGYHSKKQRYYAYAPTYVAGDMTAIGADAVGTAGAAVVPWIPVVVPVALVYGGAKFMVKRKEKTGSYFQGKEGMVSFSPADLQAFDKAMADAKAEGKDQFMFKGRPVLVSYGKYLSEYLHGRFSEQHFARKEEKISTMKTKPGRVGQAAGIPIRAEKVEKGRIYPVSPEEVKAILKRANKEDIKGIKSIEFVNPKGEQKEAWGQFVRSKKKIYIFSQPADGCRIDGQPAARVRRHIMDYVLPHEIGHYRALRGGRTDKSLALAEARADANVVGLSPFDRDVKYLVKQGGV